MVPGYRGDHRSHTAGSKQAVHSPIADDLETRVSTDADDLLTESRTQPV
jgi:hypothetical protein